jgi:hypothetical protein
MDTTVRLNPDESSWIDDLIGWPAMDVPPNFHTRMYDETRLTLVATLGSDIPHVAAHWPTASLDERGEMFWALGTLHVCEVELMKLSPAGRTEALQLLAPPDDFHLRELASKLAQVVRDMRQKHPLKKKDGEDEPSSPIRRSRAENATYLRLLAIRASGPYSGPDPDVLVCIQGGIFPAPCTGRGSSSTTTPTKAAEHDSSTVNPVSIRQD